MSLQTEFPTEIPASTRQAVEGLLPADSVYRLLGNHVQAWLEESQLAQMYAPGERGGVNPVRLSLVLIFQFLENLPDRQAAQMAVMRLDWKYALRQELTWSGFHYSDLCNFRKRLYAHEQKTLIFEQLLQHLKQAGYLQAQRQRTDATHILGAIEHLSRLEVVWETLRLAVSTLVNADAPWVLTHLPASFVQEHCQRRGDFRLNKEQVEQAMTQAGRDGFWLLAQLPVQHQTLAEIKLLQRVLDEQFEVASTGANPQKRATACGDVIASPHDAPVRYSEKGKRTQWEGYKGQITETLDEQLPLITDIGIHSAIEHDSPALSTIQARLQQRQLVPEQQCSPSSEESFLLAFFLGMPSFGSLVLTPFFNRVR